MPNRKGIFISYSHSDNAWREMLELHLRPYLDKADEEALYWDDSRIKPGEEWFTEIQDALARTKVAVLLVSKSFLGSQFIGRHEVPAIREALQSENLRLIWVPLGYSAYKTTWLSRYQAAHDPNEPLAKLSSWEQDQRLVEICEKIYTALYDVEPERPSPSPVKATRYELIRCNRTRYLNRFTSLLNAGLKDHRGRPQLYFIFGKSGQSHNSLVERMYREVIKPYADRDTGQASQSGVLHKKPNVSWPEPVIDLEEQQEYLQMELSKQYMGLAPTGYPPTFSANDFISLPELSNYRFITVQHSIDAGAWSESEWGVIVEMLRWYLQSYWLEIAKESDDPAAFLSRPQLLIFIKVSYTAPNRTDWFLGKKWSRPQQEIVKANLAELADQTKLNFPCTLLDELLTPPYSEVVRWYADNEVYDNEEDCLEAAIELYKKHGEEISMAIIEKELVRSLR